jgi:hypothetical protein
MHRRISIESRRCVCGGGWVTSEAAGVVSPNYLVRTVELKKSRECVGAWNRVTRDKEQGTENTH